MQVSEIFLTIQGEGIYTGKPSLFIRTTGCNLRCSWKNKDGSINKCDTPYTSWNPERGKKMEFKELLTLADDYQLEAKFNHVVITGGEPTLQKDLIDITNEFIKNNYIVTIETNGTLLGMPDLLKYDKRVMMSVSPKLKSANALETKLHKKNNFFTPNLRSVDLVMPNKQYKFVVNEENDFNEILEIQKYAGLSSDDIYIMPQALVDSEQKEKQEWVVKKCLEYGMTYCTRLHVNIWGDKRGV